MDTANYFSLNCLLCQTCNYCYECRSSYTSHSCNYLFNSRSCNYSNYCYESKHLRMSERMLFCLGNGSMIFGGEGYQKNNRIFNKRVPKAVFDKAIASRPAFDLPSAETYEQAWAAAWPTASAEYKKWVRKLPNFNAALFEKITGIAI